MLVYPQLTSGALAQFPVKKKRRLRTVTNIAADGSAIKLADPNGGYTEWSLPYTGITDSELAAIQQFFSAAEGKLNAFTFLDPTDNLLAWSDQLNNAVFVKEPSLTVAGGPGTWHISNGGGGPQSIVQTIAAPGAYLYCFSAYVCAEQPTTATMLMNGLRADRTVGTDFSRIVFAARCDAAQQSVGFGIELAAGVAIDIYGMQAEAQGGASAYKSSTTGGVFENARLRDDELTVTTTNVNEHSCTVTIYHANHL